MSNTRLTSTRNFRELYAFPPMQSNSYWSISRDACLCQKSAGYHPLSIDVGASTRMRTKPLLSIRRLLRRLSSSVHWFVETRFRLCFVLESSLPIRFCTKGFYLFCLGVEQWVARNQLNCSPWILVYNHFFRHVSQDLLEWRRTTSEIIYMHVVHVGNLKAGILSYERYQISVEIE